MTTITIDSNVKELLDGLKHNPKETYNEVAKLKKENDIFTEKYLIAHLNSRILPGVL